MSDEFKIYQVKRETVKNHETILQALKRALRHYCSESLMNWSPPVLVDSEHHFFYRSRQGIYWGRVFFEPLNHAGLDDLFREGEWIARQVPEQLSTFVFFPSFAISVLELIHSLPPAGHPIVLFKTARFFEYSFLWCQDQDALALKEIFIADEKDRPVRVPFLASSPSVSLVKAASQQETAYSFFRQARLNRDELRELLDIARELQEGDPS